MRSVPLTPFIGIEMTGVNAAEIMDPVCIKQILASVRGYELVVIRGVGLTPAQHSGLAREIGEPLPFVIKSYRHPEFAEIMVSSNEVRDGTPIGVARSGNYWHQDSTYTSNPATYTLLHGVNVPSTSGHTLFASAADVYNRIPGKWKSRLDGRKATHTFRRRYRVRTEHAGLSVAELTELIDREHPPVQHPLVRVDEESGRRYIFGSPEYLDAIDGFDRNDTHEFLCLLDKLIRDEQYIYTHRWTRGDVVLWKTSTTFHMATEVEPGIGRTVHRISVIA